MLISYLDKLTTIKEAYDYVKYHKLSERYKEQLNSESILTNYITYEINFLIVSNIIMGFDIIKLLEYKSTSK